jgi:hypothetical protein
VQDTLHALAATGRVEKDYIKAWSHLRNRHVHPNIKDLKKPDQAYHENLLYDITCVEVLLYQLTFMLIGYEGPYTDGVSKTLPRSRSHLRPKRKIDRGRMGAPISLALSCLALLRGGAR